MDFTSTQLIKDVKRNGSVPSKQALYEDEDFCAAFTDCQNMRIIPSVLRVREEYFVTALDIPYADLESIEGSRLQFTLPPRTIGNRIRSLELIDENGVVLSDIPKLNPDGNLNYYNPRLLPFGYIFQGNNLIMNSSSISAMQSVRLKYFRRPNRIVDATRGGRISNINTGTGVLTLDMIPDGMVTGDIADIIGGAEPFDAKADSEPITLVSGSTVTVSLATAAKLAIGDFVCFEFETVIPQLPYELFPILVQYSLAMILKSLGDNQNAAVVMNDLPELERNLYELLAVRDDGSEEKIQPGGLWNNGSRRWGW